MGDFYDKLLRGLHFGYDLILCQSGTAIIITASNARQSFLILSQQEAVYERLDEGELGFGQLAVAVAADDVAGHAVGDAETLPYCTGGLGRNVHRRVGQPYLVGIAQQQKGSRADHGTQLVLVVGQTVDGVAAEIVALAL